jgi:hypothetical protein
VAWSSRVPPGRLRLNAYSIPRVPFARANSTLGYSLPLPPGGFAPPRHRSLFSIPDKKQNRKFNKTKDNCKTPMMAIRLTQVNTTCRVQLAAKCPRYCGHLSQADTYHAHFIQPWVGNAGGRLTINTARHCTTRPFHPSRVGFADARLSGDRRYGLERRCPTLLPISPWWKSDFERARL